MTDEIIIKSLRCCTTDGCHCRDCAFQEMDDAPEYDCGHRLMMAALELIYRQMSKIEALKMDYEQAMSDAANANCNADHLSRCLDELEKQTETEKKKAVKDFAKKLIAIGTEEGAYGYVSVFEIADLAKEVCGGEWK